MQRTTKLPAELARTTRPMAKRTYQTSLEDGIFGLEVELRSYHLRVSTGTRKACAE